MKRKDLKCEIEIGKCPDVILKGRTGTSPKKGFDDVLKGKTGI